AAHVVRRLAAAGDVVAEHIQCLAREQSPLDLLGLYGVGVCPQLRLDPAGEVVEQCAFGVAELARLMVYQAEGTDDLAVRTCQRRRRVEADLGVAGHERVVRPFGVGACVGDDQAALGVDGAGTEGVVARHTAAGLEADGGLHEQAVVVDQVHRHGGDVEELLGESDDAVEPLLGRGVEQAELTHRFDACLLRCFHRVAFPWAALYPRAGYGHGDALGSETLRWGPNGAPARAERPTPQRPGRPPLRTARGPTPGPGGRARGAPAPPGGRWTRGRA